MTCANVSGRFAIGISTRWWVAVPLRVFRVTRELAWVDLGDRGLSVRFGYFSLEVPRTMIQRASSSTWSWWDGMGVQTRDGELGLVGRCAGIVLLDLDESEKLPEVADQRISRIRVSLEDPSGFLAALSTAHGVPIGPIASARG